MGKISRLTADDTYLVNKFLDLFLAGLQRNKRGRQVYLSQSGEKTQHIGAQVLF
jgi:hypothetical protein